LVKVGTSVHAQTYDFFLKTSTWTTMLPLRLKVSLFLSTRLPSTEWPDWAQLSPFPFTFQNTITTFWFVYQFRPKVPNRDKNMC
jgi:hypothetical protein